MAKKDEQKSKQESNLKKQSTPTTTKAVATSTGPNRTLTYVAVVIVVLAVLAIAYLTMAPGSVLGTNSSTASFSTFKSNLNSASRISILVTYTNTSTLNYESQCVNDVIEILSSKRAPSTIDFYETNATSCTYAPGGLGHEVTPMNATAQTCIANATGETGISIAYSAFNSTTITPHMLTVLGNAQYLTQCPIAVNLN